MRWTRANMNAGMLPTILVRDNFVICANSQQVDAKRILLIRHLGQFVSLAVRSPAHDHA